MRLLASVLVMAFFPVLAVHADQGHQHADGSHGGEVLGTVSFPTSCAPEVQKAFERGVALLHSFWYEESEKQFQQVAAADPACAMAHWGIAMSLYHQLWDRPQGRTLARGAAEVQAARSLHATARERGYIEAAGAFYAGSDVKDHEARADAYATAMEKVYRAFPDDLEAGAFYGLSLLASTPPNDTTFAKATLAVQVLMPLMRKQADHPGLAHYIIHACDNPTMAPQGLEAARRYAQIAPASPHAVHMPSHIFARLGLWQESIQSNLGSLEAQRKADEQHRGGSDHALHALDYLNYAYLQVGKDEEAKAVVEDARRVADRLAGQQHGGHGDMADYLAYARAEFPAMYFLEMHDWAGAARLEPPAGAKPMVQSITYWARGIGAARAGDAENAAESGKRFDAQLQAVAATNDAYLLSQMDVPRDELHAWLAFAAAKPDEAVRLLRDAADRQDARGKGEVEIPAREMLADMLLELGRPDEALAEYERSMKIDPNRFDGLAGAALAAEKAGKPDLARKYSLQLLENCKEADSSRVELARAKRLVEKGGSQD
jgi:tetratricopeptide (TPR) repeat protein